MQFCILLISTKISKFSASGLILWNLQLRCFSIFVCLSFSLLWFCLYVLFRQFLLLIQNAFNIGITTNCSFFSIKLICLNFKPDLNLFVSGFDYLVCIIIGTGITSGTYIDFLLPLINLDLSILYLLICCFVSSFIFLTLYFPLIYLPIRS